LNINMNKNNINYEFDYIAYSYVKGFVKRWRNKVKSNKDEKIYVFDKFIAEYIIYSSLVNVIKPAKMKANHDFEFCTNQMRKYMLDNVVNLEILLTEIDSFVKDLGKIIKEQNYTVISNKGNDPLLFEKWESTNTDERLKALLETLYYLRCNIYHGAKEFSNNQVALLSPAGKALEVINNTILSTFREC